MEIFFWQHLITRRSSLFPASVSNNVFSPCYEEWYDYSNIHNHSSTKVLNLKQFVINSYFHYFSKMCSNLFWINPWCLRGIFNIVAMFLPNDQTDWRKMVGLVTRFLQCCLRTIRFCFLKEPINFGRVSVSNFVLKLFLIYMENNTW